MRNRTGMLWGWFVMGFLTTLMGQEKPVAGYPPGVVDLLYPSPGDQSEQHTLFWAPESKKGPAPLLVALHTWSSDYRQAERGYADWCQAQGWVFLHPDFRGPNKTPPAMGSELMVADVLGAVAWAREKTPVDADRIYVVGVSGGGHAAMLLAGRAPELWAGVSAWCGISDIARWHAQRGGDKYSKDIEKALGGNPGTDPEKAAEAARRSPLTWLAKAAGVPLDLCHGVQDGRTGSVPFSHSLNAFNAVVPVGDRLAPEWIEGVYARPEQLGDPLQDTLYSPRAVRFRKISGNTRVTLFEGGHEILLQPALNWLAAQRRGQPVVWDPPALGKATGATESGK